MGVGDMVGRRGHHRQNDLPEKGITIANFGSELGIIMAG